MKCFDLSVVLLCEECGNLMRASDYDKRNPSFIKGKAFFFCEKMGCKANGKTFEYNLPVVELRELAK